MESNGRVTNVENSVHILNRICSVLHRFYMLLASATTGLMS